MANCHCTNYVNMATKMHFDNMYGGNQHVPVDAEVATQILTILAASSTDFRFSHTSPALLWCGHFFVRNRVRPNVRERLLYVPTVRIEPICVSLTPNKQTRAVVDIALARIYAAIFILKFNQLVQLVSIFLPQSILWFRPFVSVIKLTKWFMFQFGLIQRPL